VSREPGMANHHKALVVAKSYDSEVGQMRVCTFETRRESDRDTIQAADAVGL